MSLSIQSLHPALGAEVGGIDLAAPLDAETELQLRQAWAQYVVLVFRDQQISDAEHVRFSRHFGELEVLPEGSYNDGQLPEIFILSNVGADDEILPPESETVTFTTLTWFWHTDSCYRPVPSKGAILHGLEIIEGGGGETRYANLQLALQEMPADLRTRAEGKKAQHSFTWMRTHRDLPPMKPEEAATVPPVQHNLIRNHPDGSQSLYISPLYMERVMGLDERQTRELVDELTEWATQERFVYEHSWRPHDVVMWDNTWTMHLVMPYDKVNQRRTMHRTAIAGSEAVM